MTSMTELPGRTTPPMPMTTAPSMTGMAKTLNIAGLCLGALAQPSIGFAQETYPASPVRLVVGFAAGGPTDLVGRLVAQKLTAQMGMNMLVDNKPGAAGNLGAEFVARSKPDGHTLLLNSSGVVFSLAFGEKLGYDLFRDLAPVSLAATSPQLIVTHPGVPASTIGEFVAHVRANPDKLAYGSSGTGTSTHLGALLFLESNGLRALHVPYKGVAPATVDLIAGRIQFSMQSASTVLPLVRDKRINALAITGLRRSPLLPDVPTVAETMIPKFEVGAWSGVMAPAKTPAPVIRRLHAEIAKAAQDAETRAKLTQETIDLIGSSPEEYAAYLRSELDRWSRVIKSAGVKPG